MNPELKQAIIDAYQNYEIEYGYNNSSYTVRSKNCIIKFSVNYVQASEMFHLNLAISDTDGNMIQNYYRYVGRHNIVLNATGMKTLGTMSVDLLDIYNAIRTKCIEQERIQTSNIRTTAMALAHIRKNFDKSNGNSGR